MARYDKTMLITGGTRGLGYATAKRLRREGASVLITGTSDHGVTEASRSLGVEGLPLDLADPAAVERAVAQLASRPEPLDCLIANAGIQVIRPAATEDGIELTFAVNHLGHLALIDGLRRAGALPERIVLLASGTHDPEIRTFMPHPLPADVGLLREPPAESGAECLRRYASSKLVAVMTCYELARRHPELTVLAFDPGLMPGTGLARGHGPAARLVWNTAARALAVLPGVSTATRSARHLARLALGVEAVPSGMHRHLGRTTATSKASYDEDRQRRLYEDSLQLMATRMS